MAGARSSSDTPGSGGEGGIKGVELAGGRLAAPLWACGLLVPSCGRRGWRWGSMLLCGMLGPMGLDACPGLEVVLGRLR